MLSVCDFLEVGCPLSILCLPEALAVHSLLKLAFAQIVRCDDQVKLVLALSSFKQLTEPGALRSCVCRKIQDNGHPPWKEANRCAGRVRPEPGSSTSRTWRGQQFRQGRE